MTAKQLLAASHSAIVLKARLEMLHDELGKTAATPKLDALRADARAECARCCAQLRAENPELFARLEAQNLQ